MADTFQHKGLRQKLIQLLRKKGIADEAVLEAINRVPRHEFMDSGFIRFSYRDQAFPIGAGQTISQPYTVAFQTSLLQVKPLEKVLEIGTGSGYQTAVLLELGAKVFTIERQRELFISTQQMLPALGYSPHFFYGDGFEGLPSYGPFDKILITAGAPYIPEKLKEQLKTGGRMVIPVGTEDRQSMLVVDKKSNEEFETSTHGDFVFVPLLKGKSG